ncbi:BON domain-containing protein, partial [Thermodesulfobacteriota bacterium]
MKNKTSPPYVGPVVSVRVSSVYIRLEPYIRPIYSLPRAVAGDLKLVCPRFELDVHIEKLAGKYRWNKRELPVPKASVPVQRCEYRCYNLFLQAVLLGAVFVVLTSTVMAQQPVGKAGEPQKMIAPAKKKPSPAPAKVDVKPVARDEEILKRLQSVLDATDWFTDPQVRVKEGVVFLNGQVESEELKKWAGDLARNTQDVVAVANRMEVLDPPVWDFRPVSRHNINS